MTDPLAVAVMRPYPSLLVGCGARAQTHAQVLAGSDPYDLVAVCDLDAERAEETASAFEVPGVYTDLDEALERESPAHVTVVTPPNARVPVVPDVLARAPDSLVVEKPVADDLGDVERIADAAVAVDTRVVVCHQTPWADELRALASWIEAGRLGEVTRLVGSTKLGTAAQGTHFVHAANWLLGSRPERVHGWANGSAGLAPAPGGHAEPDDAMYQLTYPDDTRAFVHQGASAPDVPEQADTAPLEYKLDVVGTGGRAEYVLGHHARGVFADGTERVDARPFDEDAYMTRGLYDRLDALLRGDAADHPADLESAVAVHRTLDAALRSAIEGRPIRTDERPPAVGTPTTRRLRWRLAARTPVCVSSLLYGERPRGEVLDALAALGVHHVDLWSTEPFVDHHVDPTTESVEAVASDLDARAVRTPVVSVYDDPPVEQKLRYAAALGADTVVMGGRTPDRPDTWAPDRLMPWLDLAADLGLTLAFENHLDTLETVAEMEALLDALDHPAAGICLAPPHLLLAGGHLEEALVRLSGDVEVLYLWDVEEGATRGSEGEAWHERADSQVPGGGGAVDVERTLDLAVTHCPEAHWVLCFHGTEGWDRERIDASVARALRVVEASRPG
jgi:predicted dehydrogenase/sugar phosphate isomerase/epimerase